MLPHTTFLLYQHNFHIVLTLFSYLTNVYALFHFMERCVVAEQTVLTLPAFLVGENGHMTWFWPMKQKGDFAEIALSRTPYQPFPLLHLVTYNTWSNCCHFKTMKRLIGVTLQTVKESRNGGWVLDDIIKILKQPWNYLYPALIFNLFLISYSSLEVESTNPLQHFL